MQITEHIHALRIPFQIIVAPGMVIDRYVYVYLILGKRIALVDTGVFGAGKIIFKYLEGLGRTSREISDVILTHSHPDHIGSAKSIKELTGSLVHIHSAEKAWIESIELQFEERPVPGAGLLVEGSVKVDHVFEDGDIIRLGKDLEIEVFHTPGHSKGSVSFFMRKEKALFCGDAVLIPGQMPIFEDLVGCVDSLNRLKRLDGVELLLSSWDVPRKGDQAAGSIDESLRYLADINAAARAAALEDRSPDLIKFCKRVTDRL
ncbi:MAG: MBL fold metallo-hydrolase, partial [Candidatus Omnitrophica bacterium]|nr:MBL fold metallo-hydrolase [Candidatus Omnitrophota bacterium]